MSGELSVVFRFRDTPRCGGVSDRSEAAEVYMPTAHRELGGPLETRFIPTDPVNPACVILSFFYVSRVPFASCPVKVLYPIIGGLSVDVIYFRRLLVAVDKDPC